MLLALRSMVLIFDELGNKAVQDKTKASITDV